MLLLHKIIYVLFIFCFIKNKLIASMDWNEDNKMQGLGDKHDLRLNRCSEEFEEDCKKDFNNGDLFNALSRRLKAGIISTTGKSKRISQFFETLSSGPCQCKMNFRLMDLGSDVYPRYIHTGLCKKDSCGMFQRCQPKKYQLTVIKRRDPHSESIDSILLQEAAFPESLQDEWMPEHVTVVVGCTCLPKKGYNNDIVARMGE